MRKKITRKYYQTAAEAKLVRKSFLGVSPNTWSLETYLFQSSSDLQYFCTIGENCIPVELLKTSTKIPQPGNPFCLSYDWVSVEHVLYKRIEWIILKYEYFFIFIKMVSICGCSTTLPWESRIDLSLLHRNSVFKR